MPIIYRLVDPTGELLSDSDSIEYLRGLIQHLDPGIYVIEEIGSDPLPAGDTPRRWGHLFKLDDGTIIEESDWEA